MVSKLGCSLSGDPNIADADLPQGERSEILVGRGVGYGKMTFGVHKL